MEKERANAYLEKLSRINPKLAHEYVVLLPTLYKPDSGTPYIWLIASENACALITTLSRKPLWQEFEYAYLNSVKLGTGRRLGCYFREIIPDICKPVINFRQLNTR